ncbi:hypothetical protein [Lachnobacterium bovis]|uniref:hypothetical protein n=1 Tax=Lachnobacterium bovis TaxID=140626 RepID=UPI00048D9802|nr:hypothetical protein [Lachnobacterium bovis]
MKLLVKFLKSKICYVVYIIVIFAILDHDQSISLKIFKKIDDTYAKSVGLREEDFLKKEDHFIRYEQKYYKEGVDYNTSTSSIEKSVKDVYKKGNETCIVRSDKKVRPYEYEMNISKDRIIYYNTKNIQMGDTDECFGVFSLKSEIQIYNTNTKKVEKTVDVLAEVKRLINNKDFQSEVRKKIENSILKNKNEKKEGLLAKSEFQTPIICTDKLGKRIMVFEIPKQQDCKSIDDFEYLAYYIDEGQMKKISFEDLPDRIIDAETDFKTKNQDVSKDSVNKKLKNKIIWAQSALKTEEQEGNSYCLKNYMDRASFETLLDSNKIKYRASYLSDVAESPVHIKMFGSDLDKKSKLAKKFPELVKKYASEDYIIDWYVGDEKNSDEIAKQLLPEGKKLNYDTVHVGDNCAKNLKNASVDSLKDYYKKVKLQCILDGRKK